VPFGVSCPKKALNYYQFKAEMTVFAVLISLEFFLNLAKSWQNMAPKQTLASPDLFGVSLVHVINLHSRQ